MPYIQGPTPLNGPEGIKPRISRAEELINVNKTDPKDRVDISELARWKARLSELPSIREDLVANVKEEIQNGTYETQEKIQVASDKLLASIEEEGF